MLSKCANPGCLAKFHYFHEGKLFRWETQTYDPLVPGFGTDPTVKKTSRHLEFFWLCQQCAATMTLTYERGVGVKTMPTARAKTAAF